MEGVGGEGGAAVAPLKATEELLGTKPHSSLGAFEGPLEVDLGNLLVSDPSPLDPALFGPKSDVEAACLSHARSVLQTLVAKLFALPSRPVDVGGRMVELPAPTFPLPRHKPLPRPKPPTKWERFAKEKGIVKRKRSKLEYDEKAAEWRRRYGYKRVNDEQEIPYIEAKASDVPGEDPFSKMRVDKKARVAKNQAQQLGNVKAAAKANGRSALPSTIALTSHIPVERGMPKAEPGRIKHDKRQLAQAASIAASATASGGKFDKKLPGERPDLAQKGKRRKFAPTVEPRTARGEESKRMLSFVDSVLAKNSSDILDINKAVSTYNVESEQRRAKANKKTGGGAGKPAGKGAKGKGGKANPLGVNKGKAGIAKKEQRKQGAAKPKGKR
eukprot:jgi/Chlat1/2328/Chrsp17S02802